LSELDHLHWSVVFAGTADGYVSGVKADDWELVFGEPATGAVGIVPTHSWLTATIDGAVV
jgi:hypothetical protein